MPAEFILLTDAVITIDGDDHSGQGSSVAISMNVDPTVIGVFGDAMKQHFPGNTTHAMELEFVADEATTGAFFDLVNTVVPIKVRASSGAISVTNPSYEANYLITAYNPLGGTHGDVVTVSLSGLGASDLERKVSA